MVFQIRFVASVGINSCCFLDTTTLPKMLLTKKMPLEHTVYALEQEKG